MSDPAASFEPYRRRLLGLAYRMLGSMADAEDAAGDILALACGRPQLCPEVLHLCREAFLVLQQLDHCEFQDERPDEVLYESSLLRPSKSRSLLSLGAYTIS